MYMVPFSITGGHIVHWASYLCKSEDCWVLLASMEDRGRNSGSARSSGQLYDGCIYIGHESVKRFTRLSHILY